MIFGFVLIYGDPIIMNNAPQICVSVDVGCRQHSVAIGLPNGEVLDEFDISTARKDLNNSLNVLNIIANNMVVKWRWQWKATMAMPGPWIVL